MVAYMASQTLSHTEIVPEEEEGGSIWDTLTQRSSGRQARPTATFWDAIQENVEDDEPEYPYDKERRRRHSCTNRQTIAAKRIGGRRRRRG